MKLKELFGYTGEEQTIELIIDKWHIIAPATEMECNADDKVLNGTITSINAEDSYLVVGVDREDDD